MTYEKNLLMAIAAAFSLSACGGGASGITDPTAGLPTAGAVPASTSTADLVSFAESGGTPSTLSNGVTRYTRGFTDSNGKAGSVTVDVINGYGTGLIQYHDGNDVSIYKVDGTQVASTGIPTGTYSGPLNLNYTTNGGGAWQVASGQMSLSLDMSKGTVAIGGVASNANNSVEFFGNANVSNGHFTDNATTVRLRDSGGNFISDHTGTTTGNLAQGSGNSAIYGTVASGTSGSTFQMQGGYTTVKY